MAALSLLLTWLARNLRVHSVQSLRFDSSRMADVQAMIITPMTKFAKDSIHLVRMCTKPDAKGASRAGAAAWLRGPPPRRDLHHHTLTARPRPLRSSALAEFKKVVIATGIGFLIMGFIGFFVKLIHIPINQIILGMGN